MRKLILDQTFQKVIQVHLCTLGKLELQLVWEIWLAFKIISTNISPSSVLKFFTSPSPPLLMRVKQEKVDHESSIRKNKSNLSLFFDDTIQIVILWT